MWVNGMSKETLTFMHGESAVGEMYVHEQPQFWKRWFESRSEHEYVSYDFYAAYVEENQQDHHPSKLRRSAETLLPV